MSPSSSGGKYKVGAGMDGTPTLASSISAVAVASLALVSAKSEMMRLIWFLRSSTTKTAVKQPRQLLTEPASAVSISDSRSCEPGAPQTQQMSIACRGDDSLSGYSRLP
jgi:hypothetical protein